MISVTISAGSLEEVVAQVKVLVGAFDNPPMQTGDASPAAPRQPESPWGYLPGGVARPESRFAPIDDGTQWDEAAVRDWVRGCSPKGRQVVKVLAENLVIDPRKAADELGWDHIKWAGTWGGPRNQARRVKDVKRLTSWPYGHTYGEPRKLWIHPDIAERVLKALGG
ncbi:MAG: hypothetical protein HYU29_00300 [Chloroflexi bacterium]|nr:hypothetical protein [Chloroflexota bacterium]